jgi:hypothetical protein
MRHRSGYILVASSLVLAVLSCLAALEVTYATTAVQQLDQALVNRTLKGSRQPAITIRPKTETTAILPDGCESILSSITRSPLAQVARRCVS